MFDAGELSQQTATMAAKLQRIAFWYHIPPLAHRDCKIESAFRKGTIGIHEFEARTTARGS